MILEALKGLSAHAGAKVVDKAVRRLEGGVKHELLVHLDDAST